MFRIILSIVISALLLGLSVVNCIRIDIINAGKTEWLWFGLFAIVGIIALMRIISLAKLLDKRTNKE